MMRGRMLTGIALFAVTGIACVWWWWPRDQPIVPTTLPTSIVMVVPATQSVVVQSLGTRLADAAQAQIGVTIAYDPAYVRLEYPGGDVPIERGVCSDVVVRAFRTIGMDLQRTLHEDMRAHFSVYPKRWGLRRPDPHIDHRRVLNLMTWFERQGWSVPITHQPTDYLPGDVVAWDLGNGLTHIGIVAADESGQPAIIHNIGRGAQREAVLFAWPQIGHYRIAPTTNFEANSINAHRR